jgi:hypothetical protein
MRKLVFITGLGMIIDPGFVGLVFHPGGTSLYLLNLKLLYRTATKPTKERTTML